MKKDDLLASYLHDFILFLLKKFKKIVRKYVYFMYQVLSISNVLEIISFISDTCAKNVLSKLCSTFDRLWFKFLGIYNKTEYRKNYQTSKESSTCYFKS